MAVAGSAAAAFVVAARARLGMPARELAAILGVTMSALQRWERGVRAVPAPAVRLLYALLRDPSLLAVLRAASR